MAGNLGQRGIGSSGSSGSGGGGGSTVPPTPANSVGYVLTSTNNTGGSEPAITSSDWEPAGGFAISSFSKTHGATFELGADDTNPQFTAAYSELPDSASIIYTQQSGSPLVLSTPFTSGTINKTFTSTANAATATFTLSAVKGASTKTSTLTDTWAYGFLSDIVLTTSVAATQAFLDTMRADFGAQLHTVIAGTYLAGQTVGIGEISCIATPTALGTPVFKDKNGLITSPVLVGTVAGYMNPFGVVVSMDLYTVGGVAIGTVSWSLSP